MSKNTIFKWTRILFLVLVFFSIFPAKATQAQGNYPTGKGDYFLFPPGTNWYVGSGKVYHSGCSAGKCPQIEAWDIIADDGTPMLLPFSSGTVIMSCQNKASEYYPGLFLDTYRGPERMVVVRSDDGFWEIGSIHVNTDGNNCLPEGAKVNLMETWAVVGMNGNAHVSHAHMWFHDVRRNTNVADHDWFYKGGALGYLGDSLPNIGTTQTTLAPTQQPLTSTSPYQQVALVAPFEEKILQEIDYDPSKIISYAYGVQDSSTNLNPGGYHLGIDYAGGPIYQGINVVAIADGCRVSAPNRPGFDNDPNGWGKRVWLKHNNQTYTAYSHLDQELISTGQCVYKGQPVGTAGTSGRQFGFHFHLDAPTHHPSGFSKWHDEDKYQNPNNILGKTITIDIAEWVAPSQAKPVTNESSSPLTSMPIRQEFMNYMGYTNPGTAYAIYDISSLYGPKGQGCVRNALRSFAWPASGENLSLMSDTNYLMNHQGRWDIKINSTSQKLTAGTGLNSVDLYFGSMGWGYSQGMELAWSTSTFPGDCACYSASIIRDALWNLGFETLSTSKNHTLNAYGWIDVAGVPIVMSKGTDYNEAVVYHNGTSFQSDVWAVSSINTSLYWMVQDGKIIFWREGQIPPSGSESLPAPQPGNNQVNVQNIAPTTNEPLPAIDVDYIANGEVIYIVPAPPAIETNPVNIKEDATNSALNMDKYIVQGADGSTTINFAGFFGEYGWLLLFIGAILGIVITVFRRNKPL